MQSLQLRYILFHHQTTTPSVFQTRPPRCVISSFITKPQPSIRLAEANAGCVISSFITKPQHKLVVVGLRSVALYPLSSPNHNSAPILVVLQVVALYPLSSPNHNLNLLIRLGLKLRYILFHHQTTTHAMRLLCHYGLRYILFHHQTTTLGASADAAKWLRYILFHHQTTTKCRCRARLECCVISSFITKPQLFVL